jgi:hypothetical protein
MNNILKNILKIKEPGAIHLNDDKRKKTDRAPIDISLNRSSAIDFPWEEIAGSFPDEIDLFKYKIRKSINIEIDVEWTELVILDDLIYHIKEGDCFYYGLVQWYNTNQKSELTENSKVLIYNKLTGNFYEPYKKNIIIEEGNEYELFNKEDFDKSKIKSTFEEITHLRQVFRPTLPDESVLNHPFSNSPSRFNPRINPLTNSFLNIDRSRVHLNFNRSSFEPLEHLLLPKGYIFESDLVRSLNPRIENIVSLNGADYIFGELVPHLLDEAKNSHRTEDPIKKIIKKPVDWKNQDNLEFFYLKENISSDDTEKYINQFLCQTIIKEDVFNHFFESVSENQWVAGFNGRYYLIELEDEDPKFNTIDAYLNNWENNINHITLLAYKAGNNDLVNPLASSRYYDISLSAIIDEYKDIQAMKKFSNGRNELANALILKVKTIADYEFDEFKESINSIEQKHSILINANNDIDRKERILKERVKKFGYSIEENPNKEPHIIQNQQVSEIVRQAYNVSYTYWKGLRKKTRRRTLYRNVEVIIYKKIEVKTPENPWSDEIEQLQKNGYNVYFFEQSKNGFVTSSGEKLVEIMKHCEFSETIRLKTAIMIPKYEQSTTKGIRLVGYTLFVRPLTGDVPNAFPNISLEESLAYRANWKGSEVSELIKSINLAPGESRNIVITQNFESNKAQTQSVTSILDVTEKNGTSFTDFFEQTNQNTSERITTTKWDAKVSGSYGGFINGGVSGGGTSQQTNKSFAQQIKRAANESSREMKKQTRIEINTQLSESSKLIIDESISSNIQNINDGTSLNLFFYRLDNVYEGGLHLEDLKMTYTRPLPLIQGTEIKDVRFFEFYEFDKFLEMVTSDALLVLSPILTNMEMELKEIEIRFSIMFRIFKKIFREYFYNTRNSFSIDYPEPIKENDSNISGESIDAEGLSDILKSFAMSLTEQKERYEKVRGKLKSFTRNDDGSWWVEYRNLINPLIEVQSKIEAMLFDIFNSIEYSLTPIGGYHLFSIPSNGAYLDCVVGTSSGLEQYSEDMRQKELNRQKAEIEVINAQALRLRAGAQENTYLLESITIDSIEVDEQHCLFVHLDKALPLGNWTLSVNNIKHSYKINNDRKSIKIQNWVTPTSGIIEVKLVESNGVYILRQF